MTTVLYQKNDLEFCFNDAFEARFLLSLLENMKEKILREIKNGKEEILEGFLCKVKQIEDHLGLLYEEGIDRDRCICFEGCQEWLNISYSVVKKEDVIALLRYLMGMEKNQRTIIRQFEKLQSKDVSGILLKYEEYTEMEKMEDTYNALIRAEEELESLIL